MDTAPVYTVEELREDPSLVLAAVNASGRAAAITRHGRFVALIVPLEGVPVETIALSAGPVAEEIRHRAENPGPSTTSPELLAMLDEESRAVRAAVEQVPARLRATLGALRGANRGAASAIVQLIPFEERPQLEALGILREGPEVSGGFHSAEITDFGWRVIDACPDLNEERDRVTMPPERGVRVHDPDGGTEADPW